MSEPTLVLVGADKGGVGKTTIARTLMDYLSSRKMPVRAYDTEYPRGTLARFHGSDVEIVDMANVADQIRVIDNLTDSAVTLIDVRAGLFSPLLVLLDRLGVLDGDGRDKIKCVFMHVLGPTVSSLAEIDIISQQARKGNYLVIKNHINDTRFYDADIDTINGFAEDHRVTASISVPKLNEMAAEQVDLASVPFAKYVFNKGQDNLPQNYSFTLRGYVRHWLKTVWAEYDRVQLSELLKSR